MITHPVSTRLIVASQFKLPTVLQTESVVELYEDHGFFVRYRTTARSLAWISQIKFRVVGKETRSQVRRPYTNGGRYVEVCGITVQRLIEVYMLDHDHTGVVV